MSQCSCNLGGFAILRCPTWIPLNSADPELDWWGFNMDIKLICLNYPTGLMTIISGILAVVLCCSLGGAIAGRFGVYFWFLPLCNLLSTFSASVPTEEVPEVPVDNRRPWRHSCSHSWFMGLATKVLSFSRSKRKQNEQKCQKMNSGMLLLLNQANKTFTTDL